MSDILDTTKEVFKLYKVKERREKLKLTQEEVAKRAGISRQTLISIESDMDFSTSTTTLIKIANALQCKVTDIFFA